MVLFDEILKKGLSVTITDKVKVIHHLILGNLLYCLFAVNEAIRSFRLLQCKISSPACGTTLMTSNSLTWDTAIDINSPQSIGFLWLLLVIIYCGGTVVKCSQKHPRNQKRWKLMIILFQSVSSPFSARLRSSSAITLLAPNNHPAGYTGYLQKEV